MARILFLTWHPVITVTVKLRAREYWKDEADLSLPKTRTYYFYVRRAVSKILVKRLTISLTSNALQMEQQSQEPIETILDLNFYKNLVNKNQQASITSLHYKTFLRDLKKI